MMSDNPRMLMDESREAEFVRVLTSHQLDIYLYVHSLVPDPESASEIVQNTNTVLWQKRNQFDLTTDFRAWAFQVARYEVSEYRVQRKRQGLSFSDALVDELAFHAPRFTNDNDDVMEDLRRCVAQLAANDRELLRKRYSSDASCESIAKATNRSVRWVYNALSRIRRELRTCVAHYANKRSEQ